MNIATSIKHINIPEIDITIYTDASLKGWGITDGSNPSGGRWAENEMQHINVLELKAALFGIIAYCKNESLKNARIMVDNTTAIAYINNMGGTKLPQCNELAMELWLWANVHISAAHIPGVCNITADEKLRNVSDATEWQLNHSHFQKICTIFGTPDIDLFASRLNRQVSKYVSWHPETEAHAIDAFSLKCSYNLCYIFPPFSMIGK